MDRKKKKKEKKKDEKTVKSPDQDFFHCGVVAGSILGNVTWNLKVAITPLSVDVSGLLFGGHPNSAYLWAGTMRILYLHLYCG